MAKFRKRPVVVYAEQFWPNDLRWPMGVRRDFDREGLRPKGIEGGPLYCIQTLEGKHEVIAGDWIITGVQGERYPCKADIFALTYEAVE